MQCKEPVFKMKRVLFLLYRKMRPIKPKTLRGDVCVSLAKEEIVGDDE